MKEMEMKTMGIKEIIKQVETIADKKLLGRKGCVASTDNEIVLCVKNKPGYHTTGVTFEADTPRLILTTATKIINRMVFNLSPDQASAIITSTTPKVLFIGRNNRRPSTHIEKMFPSRQ
jgi:hypothetical protein